ncbi:MAG: sigma-70 family RNA polymerase sigma factor [Thermoguttaceae bacterium]
MSGVCETESLNNWSDEELLLEYRLTGRRELFEELVGRYEQKLFYFLRRLAQNRDDAEELFQTTFHQVHLKCDYFEEGRSFKPWLYRIAMNVAIDRQRKQRRQVSTISIDLERDGEDGSFDSFAGSLPDQGWTPDLIAEKQERRQMIHAAIEALPECYRETILLVYFQGLSYRETAEVLDIPFGTVKSHLLTAFNRLSSTLRDLI